MVRKRPLTSEEKLLWKHITRHDKPLETNANIKNAEALEKEKITQQKQVIRSKIIKSDLSNSNIQSPPEKLKGLGNYFGIDRKTAERFRKGDSPIDATVDLHGMTRENAYQVLIAFIEQQVSLKKRRLLVITGKGAGILQSSLPDWLSAPSLSTHILAFDVAKPKHGGAGAFYILLKRKRK